MKSVLNGLRPRLISVLPAALLQAVAVLFLISVAAGAASAQTGATPPALRGDVDNDGAVNSIDALSVLASIVGRELPEGYQVLPNGDADGSGDITLVDALIILGYAVQKDVSEHPVGRPVVALNVAPAAVSLHVGEQRALSVVLSRDAGAVQWRSTSTSIAAVDERGVVVGVGEGKARVIAISSADTTVRSEVKVSVTRAPAKTVEVASIFLAAPDTALQLGESVQLEAIARDKAGAATSSTISWLSSDPTVVSVDPTGLAQAVGVGSATVTAFSGGKTAAVSLSVARAAVASVAINPARLDLTPGQVAPLAASFADAAGAALTGRIVTWSSSASGVAIVDSKGNVTAVAPGNATVTATSEGRSSSVPVVVKSSSNSLEPQPTKNVVSVELSEASHTFTAIGQTHQLTAQALDPDGQALTGISITWKSIAPEVVEVSADGLITAKRAGAATLTATVEGKEASIIVEVEPVVTQVELTAPVSSLEPGASTQLVAKPRDANGHPVVGASIGWSSSDTTVAKVSAEGVVTAKKVGSVTITASSDDAAATTTVKVASTPVVPDVAVASVAIDPTSHTFSALGQTRQLSATPKNAAGQVLTDKTRTWSSSDPAVATVSETGVVTAKSNGTTTVKVTIDGVQASTAITVAQQVSTLALAPSATSLEVGKTLALVAIAKDAGGSVVPGVSVSWTSSSGSVATVQPDGVVTGVGAGSATITGVSQGRAVSVDLTVTAPAPVLSMRITAATTTLTALGSELQLDATLVDADDKLVAGSITWTSSNPAVATVSGAGVVKAVANGTASITATAAGVSASLAVTVAQVAKSVEIAPTTLTLKSLRESAQLSATIRDANGAIVAGCSPSWTSLSPSIVGVDSMGKVLANLAGMAMIVAGCGGVADTTGVTVDQEVVTIAVTPQVTSVTVGESTDLNVNARDAGGSAVPESDLVWRSSDPNVATVTSTGVVTAVGEGEAVISVEKGAKTANSMVHVSKPIEYVPGPFNEPAGMTTFVDQDGSTKDWGPGWRSPGVGRWLSTNEFVEVVEDPTNPTGSGRSIEYRFPAGALMRDYRHIYTAPSWENMPGGFKSREIYMRVRIQLSPNFQTSTTENPKRAGMKVFGYLGHEGDPSGYFVDNHGGGALPWTLRGTAQPGNDFKFAGGTGAHFGAYPMWNTIEIYQKAQSAIGANDGIFRMWVNGVLVTDRTDMDAPRDPDDALLLDGMEFGPMRGHDTDPLPETDYMRIGELHVSGKR